MTKTFEEMGLPEALQHTLQHMKFTTPTPIQVAAIPMALSGKDILGSAQTGTGKTGAFGIPLVAHIMKSANGCALVMTPTRELASQVSKQLHLMLGGKSKIKTALLIGGDSMGKQLQQLKQNPRIIVGTPGRINDHLERKSLKLEKTDFLVLDETDRMLDMGFTIQIERILSYMSQKRQTLLFSATLPKKIEKMAAQYMNAPERVAIEGVSLVAKNIKQDVVSVTQDEKYPHLQTQLNNREGSIIVFVKTKFGTEKMAKKLAQEGYSTNAIHGDLRQNKRDRVIKGFRDKKYRILIATDVAARGLDIPHIEHVINYDLPQSPEDYIHRIGRTARAGAEGQALSLIAPSDKRKWREIEQLLDPDNDFDGGEQTSGNDGSQKRRHKRRFNGGKSKGSGYDKSRKFAGKKEFGGKHKKTSNKTRSFGGSSNKGGQKRSPQKAAGARG